MEFRRSVVWLLSVLTVSFMVSPLLSQDRTATEDFGDGVAIQDVFRLRLPESVSFSRGDNRSFRSAAIHFPYVYVLDRQGTLYIYRIPESSSFQSFWPNEIPSVSQISSAGDGNDVRLVENSLLLTQRGAVRVYALDTPHLPRFVGEFGTVREECQSQSLLLSSKRAFTINGNVIVTYDVTQPLSPKEIDIHQGSFNVWSGCVAERHHLYAAGHDSRNRSGILVFDVVGDTHLRQVSFVETATTPYLLFALSGGRLLATMDSNRSVLLTTEDPAAPRIVGSFECAGGRTGAVLMRANKDFFVNEDAVFRVTGNDVTPKFAIPPPFLSSTADGFPYHGDCEGDLLVVPTDRVALLLRCGEGKGILPSVR